MLKSYQIQQGHDIYDVANNLLGGFDNIMTLIQLNPDFESIDVNLDNFAGKNMTYDDSYYKAQALQIQLSQPETQSTIRTFYGLEGQNIYDAVLWAYGDLGMTLKFIQDNAINSTNDQRVAFKELKFDMALNNNLSFKKVVEKKGYQFASLSDESAEDYRITSDNINRLTSNLIIRTIS
jgi:hypothetical protein